MTTPALRWWLFAQDAVRRLTCPREDIAAADLAVERRLRQSALFGVAHAAGEALGRAWMHSRARGLALAIRADLPRSNRRLSAGFVGVVVLVACLTSGILHACRSMMP